MFIALAAIALNSLAQQPPGRNGGGGPPGGGFGRGGFGGGFGGPGGGNNSLLGLASNPAVQEDMKVKDKQKAQIKSLNDRYQQQMRELRTQMGGFFGGPGQGGGPQGKGQGRGRGQNQNGAPNAQANAPGGQAAGGFGGGVDGQVQDPNAPAVVQNQGGGFGGGGRGNRGNGNPNGPGGQIDPERAQQFAAMREATDELRQTAESSLGKILDKGQAIRLKQIQLQLAGPSAVLREDMMDKLQIDESQVALIREVMGEHRVAQRETRKTRGDLMKAAFARLIPASPNNGQNDGNGGTGQNGGNGRNGGRRGGRFDPEAMKKVMDDPQVKAQMEEIEGQNEKIENMFASAVNKVLTRRQLTTYKRMLGAPFDRSKMTAGGPPWGGPRGNGPGNQAKAKNGAAAATTAPTASAGSSDDEDAPATTKPSTAAPPKAKASTTPKRKSLRELRGIPEKTDN